MARLSWRLVVMAGALLVGAGALVFFAVAGATSSPSSEFDAPEPSATASLASAQLSPPADLAPTPTAEPAVEEPGHEHTPLPPPPVADPTATPTCDLVVDEASVPIVGLDPANPDSGEVIELGRLDILRNPCTGEIFTRDVATGEIRSTTTLGDEVR